MIRHAVVGQIAAVSFAVGCLALTALPQEQPTRRPGQTAENQQERDARNQRDMRDQRAGTVHFIAFSDFNGKDVVNSNGEEIGSISDIIVERGSNRAKFYVVQSGDWAGLGGRHTAVPVSSFQWDRANDRPLLNATTEQLRTMPEFTEEEWNNLERTGTSSELSRALSRETTGSQRDPYLTGDAGSLEPISVSGTITQVERRDSDAAGEEIIVVVDTRGDGVGEGARRDRPTPDRPQRPERPERPTDPNRTPGAQGQATGQSMKIILGPSWYVMSRAEAPMRGYTFKGDVVRLQRAQGDAGYVALNAEINGEHLALRDENTMKPLWTLSSPTGERDTRTPDARRPGDPRPGVDDRPLGDEEDAERKPGMQDDDRNVRDTQRDTRRDTQRDTRRMTGTIESQSSRSPFVLLSEVHGAEVQARGQECGSVQDILLDQPSGIVAFYVIDPDENFLGIADTTRLVPASVAGFGTDDVLRIDASKEMVLQSKEMPDDIKSLEQGNTYREVYRAYEVDVPNFQARGMGSDRGLGDERGMGAGPSDLSGWSADSDFAKSVNKAKDQQIKGEIVRIERKEPARGMASATAIVLNTDQGSRTVLLGPSWFIDQQDLPFKEGDTVTVVAREADLNGQKMLVACKARGDEGRELVFWDVDTKKPAWDRGR